MKKMLAMIFAGLMLAGCGTTTTTKVTEYDSAGNVVKVTETVSDNSDFANYFATGDGNATDLRGDISKFNGLEWVRTELVVNIRRENKGSGENRRLQLCRGSRTDGKSYICKQNRS